MKKIIILLSIICGVSYSSFADQIMIYKTIADYKLDKPTIVEGEVSTFQGPDGALVYVSGFTVKNTKKEHFYSNDFWGFKFKDILFRSFKFKMKQQKNGKESYGYMALVSQGKIVYWENGLAILDILTSDKTPKKGFLYDQACNGLYGLSKDVESEIYSARFNEFFRKYPEYKAMPADYAEKVLNNKDCRGPKEPNLTLMNKLYDIGGTDDIAYMNLYTGVNNNAGKTMGMSAAIFVTTTDDKNTECRRNYYKEYNGGNFEKQIEGSVISTR
jgi:hypothetical protein